MLHHNDRLFLGTSTYLVYIAPHLQLDPKYDWDYIQNEIISNINALKEIQIDNEVTKYKQKLDKHNKALQEEIQDMNAEYEQKIQILKDKKHDETDLDEI